MNGYLEGLTGLTIHRHNELHVRSEVELKALFTKLAELGYTINDLRKDKHRLENRKWTPERMIELKISLWFAKLDVTRGKCGSCKNIIGFRAIQTHQHSCEICGEFTYIHVVDGGSIEFAFPRSATPIKLYTQRWDTDEGYLYLYPGFIDDHRGEMSQCFAENPTLWTEVTENGQKLIRVTKGYEWDASRDIHTYRTTGSIRNYTEVHFWRGVEYTTYGEPKLPVLQTINIHEDWHT